MMSKVILTGLILLISQQVLAADSSYFIHCYDFGCKSNQRIQYGDSQWQQIAAQFEKIDNAFDEKQAIRKAIALMEQFSGQLVGTDLDKGGNYPGYDIEKQQDCIDESTNTLQYLNALEERNLLNWHRVEPKVRRIVWFISHWTAVISELETKKLFAVDSWYRDNGEPPYLQLLADWKKDRDFPSSLNPENL